jgi:hypothetical protein
MRKQSEFIAACKIAGIAIPDNEINYSKWDFPHWYVFCKVHVRKPVSYTILVENAKAISNVAKDVLRQNCLSD